MFTGTRSQLVGLDHEFDPLTADDFDINQEDMDDDNPQDIVDYPTLRNMPQSMQRDAVYTPERQGSVRQAVLELLDHNPGRRPILLAILEMCANGCVSSVLSSHVDQAQCTNRSVYAPMTLCRMLERTGALTLEMPPVAEEHEDVQAGVEYLEIKGKIDPVWRTTAEGLATCQELTQGASFHDIVLDRDSRYIEVYHQVMSNVAETPRSKTDIEELVDTFDIVKSPRRFGGHFIDMLERTGALEWNGSAWRLTALGHTLLPAVQEMARKEKAYA